ncbi:hypothetical protein Tco_0508697 [Tanacetum coccineum]
MNYMQQPMPNPEDISDPKTTIDMALVLMANAFKLNNTTPINNNQISSSNPRDRQIAQSGMNMDQNRQMLMVEDNVGDQIKPNVEKIIGNRNGYNLVQNVGNLFGQNAVQNSNIQKIANQKDRSAEVHQHENNSDNNMFTQEEHYTDLLEFTTEPHLVQQNDNNVIPAEFIMESSGGTVEQHPTTVEETRAFFESLYNNLVMEVEKVNIVNHKMKETNAELTIVLARYKGQEKAAKFVRDFKSLAKEVDESLDRIKRLENENDRLLRVVVSQDIKFIVQSPSVVDTSDLQTELEYTKEKFETCIIKKENEYAKLWNDWYKKCEECKYDKISYDKAYNYMQHQIERLQAQLGDLKDVNSNTNGVSSTSVESTAKTRKPLPKSNPKNDRIPSASKSSCLWKLEGEIK